MKRRHGHRIPPVFWGRSRTVPHGMTYTRNSGPKNCRSEPQENKQFELSERHFWHRTEVLRLCAKAHATPGGIAV